MSDIPVILSNPSLAGLAFYTPHLVYSTAQGRPLSLELLQPASANRENPCPLILFIQGSSWTHPNPHRRLPQLCAFAQMGMAVASITHRSCDEAPFPAFLQDAKTALRFLRAYAQEYFIDPDRAAVWGTSSGGNAALLMGLTGEAYKTEEYPEQSCQVAAVVDCFGPTDLPDMIRLHYPIAKDSPGNVFEKLSGKPLAESHAELCAMSPTRLVRPGLSLPPFLLLHGDADPIVDYSQSLSLYKKLTSHGYEASLYRVQAAPHEGSFWSQDLLDVIAAFLKDKLSL